MTTLATLDGFRDNVTTPPPVVILPAQGRGARDVIQSDAFPLVFTYYAPGAPIPAGYHLADLGEWAWSTAVINAGRGFYTLPNPLAPHGTVAVLTPPTAQPRLQPARGFREPLPHARHVRAPQQRTGQPARRRQSLDVWTPSGATPIQPLRRKHVRVISTERAERAKRRRAWRDAWRSNRPPREPRPPRLPRLPRLPRTPRAARKPRPPRTSGTKPPPTAEQLGKRRRAIEITAEQAACKALYERGPIKGEPSCHWSWLGFACKCTPAGCTGPLAGYLKTAIGLLPKGWFPKPPAPAVSTRPLPRPRGAMRFLPLLGGTLQSVPLIPRGPLAARPPGESGCAAGSVCCAGLTGVGCGPPGPSCALCNAREAAALALYQQRR